MPAMLPAGAWLLFSASFSASCRDWLIAIFSLTFHFDYLFHWHISFHWLFSIDIFIIFIDTPFRHWLILIISPFSIYFISFH
jgi:hypothetical protein